MAAMASSAGACRLTSLVCRIGRATLFHSLVASVPAVITTSSTFFLYHFSGTSPQSIRGRCDIHDQFVHIKQPPLLLLSLPLPSNIARSDKLASTSLNMPAMDQKEVIEQLKLLQKAVAEKQPSENVKAILQKLKDDVVATEELLRVRLLP